MGKKGPGQQLSSRVLGGSPERERKAVDSVSKFSTVRVKLKFRIFLWKFGVKMVIVEDLREANGAMPAP